MRGSRLIVLLLLSLPTLPAWGQDSVRIEVSPKRAAYDTRIEQSSAVFRLIKWLPHGSRFHGLVVGGHLGQTSSLTMPATST
jgi:hypothetical protein